MKEEKKRNSSITTLWDLWKVIETNIFSSQTILDQFVCSLFQNMYYWNECMNSLRKVSAANLIMSSIVA